MPKREPTPPPADSEPYYLTILNPYPPNASMGLAGDLQKLALWLAAVTKDSSALMAIFHKPSSPRLVILELHRGYSDIRRLLGQHFWGGPKSFLITPATTENYSAIFFCHYTTARQVEKHGWKREWFYDTHFPGQAAINKIFKHPYPATTYMQVPATDPTALEFCRHLPLDLFPEVGSNKDKPAEAPVGSTTWAVKKEQRPPGAKQKQSTSAQSETSSSVSAVTVALSTLDVAREPQEPEEPLDLWAAPGKPESGSVTLMSDLALASVQGESGLDKGVCPWHGLLCKKMCDWRTDYDKKRGPKSEGPSNIKNYTKPSRGGKGEKGRPRLNTTRSSEPSVDPSSPESANASPVTTPASTVGKGAPTIKRAPPPPPVLAWSSVVSPIKQATPEAVPSGTPTAGAGRGVPNGPVRGAPAWSSRGRGRGRAV